MSTYRVTITASVPSDHRTDVPTSYSEQTLVALIRERSAAQDYLDFDGQPDDVVLAEGEANEELRRIVFDAPHVQIEEVEA